ncbi:MAG: TspO/MBR family protein, partial [Anaerovoracaceae bacterium]
VGSQSYYSQLQTPPLSPPGFIFPIVWTILYTLMGISSYLIYFSSKKYPQRKPALVFYLLQLAVNMLWSICFFTFTNVTAAMICLVCLWLLIIFMLRAFSKVNRLAMALQIPYLLWVTFAGYLNGGILFLQ